MRTLLGLVHKMHKPAHLQLQPHAEEHREGQVQEVPGIPHRQLQGAVRRSCGAKEDYDANIVLARQIVRGRITVVLKLLKEQMQAHAEKLEFERAEEVRERIERLDSYRARSTVVNPDVGDVDVFGLAANSDSTFVNYMRVIDGAIVQGVTVELKRPLEESDEEVLRLAIAELRQRYHSTAPEAIVAAGTRHRNAGVVLPRPATRRQEGSCWN